MQIAFYKYQGTGNDFVMIDNRTNTFPKEDAKLIELLCDRKFGVGADGLILLENHSKYNFTMVYYNSDGNESTMCGNGGRCLVAFAKQLGLIEDKAEFDAVDGYHFATINQYNMVSLQMKDVDTIESNENYIFLNTGSPHHVTLVNDLESFNVKVEGAKIRYSSLYGKAGSNVNFVSPINKDTFTIRTYERGVENETLSCGTGATAVAIAMYVSKRVTSNHVNINVEGGKLAVNFNENKGVFTNVNLIGPATFVFEGIINI